MTATRCCVCVVAWLAVSVPLALFFGRACALYQRCRYVDDLTREYCDSPSEPDESAATSPSGADDA